MIAPSLSSLLREPTLLLRCSLGDDVQTTINKVSALSSTSSFYRTALCTNTIFRMIVAYFNPEYPFINTILKGEGDSIIESKEKISLKRKFFDLRNYFNKVETNGQFFSKGQAFADEDGVKFITAYIESDDQHEIKIFNLTDQAKVQTIKIERPRQSLEWKKSHYSACSEEFLAFNHDYSSDIYVYTRKSEPQLMGKYEVEGIICQLAIKGNLLCVVEKFPDDSNDLVIFDIKIFEQQIPVKISLPQHTKTFPPPRPICFGKEHLIYIQSLVEGNQIYALPLSAIGLRSCSTAATLPVSIVEKSAVEDKVHDLKPIAPLSCLYKTETDNSLLPWIKGTMTPDSRYLLPDGVDFIEVTFKDCYICDISKMTVSTEVILKTELVKDITIFQGQQAARIDVCFLNGRLFVTYDDKYSGSKLFSYDIVSGKDCNLLSTTSYPDTPPCLLSVAGKVTDTIYVFFMHHENWEKSHLTTLIYGKV